MNILSVMPVSNGLCVRGFSTDFQLDILSFCTTSSQMADERGELASINPDCVYPVHRRALWWPCLRSAGRTASVTSTHMH